jgi:hypothetical protein
MLKRVLLVVTCLIVLAAALAVPLRREYSIIHDDSNGADQLTSVHYGTPVTWLVLSKQVDAHQPEQVKKQTRQYDYKALAVDVAGWGLLIVFVTWFSLATDRPLITTKPGSLRR